MDTRKNKDLLRQLIGAFALADGWIDRWQGDDRESDIYKSRFEVLSRMIISQFRLLDGIRTPSGPMYRHGEALSLTNPGREFRGPSGNPDPERMRMMLRKHLGDVLWLLDLQEDQPFDGPMTLTLGNGKETDVLAFSKKIRGILDECLVHLEALGEPLEDLC